MACGAGVAVACELARQYERLRRARLQREWGGRGLALLMRQGMLAWIRAVTAARTSGERLVAASTNAGKPHGKSIVVEEPDMGPFQAEAVGVLTSMAVSVLREMWV